MTAFKVIPPTTKELRRIAADQSDAAADIATATARNQVGVWQEAMRKCMIAEGVDTDRSSTAAQHAGGTLAEIHRLSDLLARHWGFLDEYVRKIEGHVSVARDVKAGQTFRVDA